MGPIAWLTILHTYFIGLFNNFSAEPEIKGQMYKEGKREGGRGWRKKCVVKRMKSSEFVCVRGMMLGKGKQDD